MTDYKVALVTGASGGIGGACAVALARQGYHIGVHYHTNEARARQILQEVKQAGAEGWLVQFDATEAKAVEQAIRRLIKDQGRLDALVVTAGVVFNQMMALTSAEDLDRLWAINLRAAYVAAKTAAKAMLREHRGRIVFIGSVIGLRGNAGQTAYAATKAGLVGLAKSLARELAPRNITVNIIAPGFVETEATKDLTDDQRKAILQYIPLHRAGTTEEIAAAVAFLCSEVGSYITGAVLPVDGGLGM